MSQSRKVTNNSEWKRDWIIGVCNSEGDGVDISRFFGTEDEARRMLIQLLEADLANDEESFEYGTTSAEGIEKKNPEELNAYATYSSYHIDYTAKTLSSAPFAKLDEPKNGTQSETEEETIL